MRFSLVVELFVSMVEKSQETFANNPSSSYSPSLFLDWCRTRNSQSKKAREHTQVVAGLEKDETETRIKFRPLKTASHKAGKKDDISFEQEIRHMESYTGSGV